MTGMATNSYLPNSACTRRLRDARVAARGPCQAFHVSDGERIDCAFWRDHGAMRKYDDGYGPEHQQDPATHWRPVQHGNPDKGVWWSNPAPEDDSDLALAKAHHRDCCLDNHDEDECLVVRWAKVWEGWGEQRGEIIDILRGLANGGRPWNEGWPGEQVERLNKWRKRATSVLGMVDT